MKYRMKDLKSLLREWDPPVTLLTVDPNTATWVSIIPGIGIPEDFQLNFMSDGYLDNIIINDSINGCKAYALDTDYLTKYGDKWILGDFEDKEDALAFVQTSAQYAILSKAADLQRLFYTLTIEYNPLYNKDVKDIKTVVGTTNQKAVSGTLEATSHTGTVSDATTGEVENIEASTISGKDGANDTIENFKTTTTNKRVPYNGSEEVETDKSEVVSDVSKTQEGRTNNVDYSTTRTYLNTDTKTADYTDTNSANYTETTTSQGNQGVTMSEQMINAEYDMRIKKSFWAFVYKIALDHITYYMDF